MASKSSRPRARKSPMRDLYSFSPSPPVNPRPESARRGRYAVNSRKVDVVYSGRQDNTMRPTSSTYSSRPTSASSLSPYAVLPGISQTSSQTSPVPPERQATESNQARKTRKNSQRPVAFPVDENSNIDKSKKPSKIERDKPQPGAQKNVSKSKKLLGSEPGAREKRVLLAVKLLDGRRLQRYFRPGDLLLHIIEFAETTSGDNLAGYELICDMPKTVYRNLHLTIEASGLTNRTLLHLELPDD